MKSLFSAAIAVFVAVSFSAAQDSTVVTLPVQQKIQQFQKRPGKVVLIEYAELGKLESTMNESIKFETAYSCYLADRSKFIKALRLTTERKNSSSGGVFFIDVNELTDLSNALNTMVQYSTRSSDEEKPFSDVTYRTHDGFEIGFTHIGKEQSGYYRMAPNNGDYASLKIELLSAFKQLVDKGIAKLKSK
ncbi:MAG: hypothetical protein NTU47_00255 [Ignavibacteriales bacterium]|nr:hypothetical protein [Ignavibacteriales bacterium]